MDIGQKHIDQYREYLLVRKLSPNTIKTYVGYAKSLQGKKFDQKALEKSIIKRGNNYPSFLRSLVDCFGIGLTIPPIKGRNVNKRPIHYFTKDEIETIVGTTQDVKFQLILRLMFEYGLRVSEVCALKKKNFDLVNKKVKGVGKGNKPYQFELFDRTYRMLQKYLIPFDRGDFVFSWPVKQPRHKVWRMVKEHVMGALPYKEPSEVYPHVFRHSTATYLIEQGLNLREVQEYMRHSRLSTIEPYSFVDNKKLIDKVRKVMD